MSDEVMVQVGNRWLFRCQMVDLPASACVEPFVVMRRRPLPDWLYAVPDGRNVRITELEAALMETNDVAARLSAALLEEKKQLYYVKVDACARSEP